MLAIFTQYLTHTHFSCLIVVIFQFVSSALKGLKIISIYLTTTQIIHQIPWINLFIDVQTSL